MYQRKVIALITVIGAGKVGSEAAFDILRYKISDVVLIDANENQAKGEALDMMQAAPAIEFDGKITRNQRLLRDAGFGACDCDGWVWQASRYDAD